MQAAVSRQQLEERECSRELVTHENLCRQSAEMLQTLLIPCSRQRTPSMAYLRQRPALCSASLERGRRGASPFE
jgi:hypothetical protein